MVKGKAKPRATIKKLASTWARHRALKPRPRTPVIIYLHLRKMQQSRHGTPTIGSNNFEVTAFNRGKLKVAGSTSSAKCSRITAMIVCAICRTSLSSTYQTECMKDAVPTKKDNGKFGDRFKTALFTNTIYTGHEAHISAPGISIRNAHTTNADIM